MGISSILIRNLELGGMIRNLDNETITVTLKQYVWRQLATLRDSYQGKIWQKEKLANNGGDR